MTDEEKAFEYMIKTSFRKVVATENEIKQAYLDGLKEGREEKCNSCGLRQQKRINLEKENAELKKYCDCEYCHKNNSGDEFTVEGTNKTLCEYCLENNKKFFEL